MTVRKRGQSSTEELTAWLRGQGDRGSRIADVMDSMTESIVEWRRASAKQAETERKLRDEIEQLKSRLPESMQDCTIRFRECQKGHGWLTADNWIQHDCKCCEIEQLQKFRRFVERWAKQPLIDELHPDDEGGDPEGAYDAVVTEARDLMKRTETTKDCEHRNRAEFLDGEYCLTCEQKLPEKDSQ